MGKSKGKKRKANSDMRKSKGKRKATEDMDNGWIQDVDLPNVGLPTGWIQKLLALGPDLAYLIATLSTEGKIPTSQIKKAKLDLPSFSSTRWNKLAPTFGLPFHLTMASIDSFSVESLLLPSSFHETTVEEAWRILDVFQEPISQYRGETRIRTFDAVRPICQSSLSLLILLQVPYPNCGIVPRSDC